MSIYPWRGIVGWTYDAAFHCNSHAIERFTEAGLFDHDTVDSEGNEPAPVFSWGSFDDATCDECAYESLRNRPASHSDQDIDNHNAAVCSICNGTGQVERHYAPTDEWILSDCYFCTGTGENPTDPDCACANCGHLYTGGGDSDNGYDCPKCGHNDTGDDSDDPTSVFYRVPSVVVTPSGIQFMLPGETPSPVRKGGDTDQTRMF